MTKENHNPARQRGTDGKLASASKNEVVSASDLLSDVRLLIQQACVATGRAVNAGMVILYWSIGNRIQAEILKDKRAEYGKQILATLSQELTASMDRAMRTAI